MRATNAVLLLVVVCLVLAVLLVRQVIPPVAAGAAFAVALAGLGLASRGFRSRPSAR